MSVVVNVSNVVSNACNEPNSCVVQPIGVFGSGRCRCRGGEWMGELDLGFTNPVGTMGVLDVCLCLGCSGVGGVGGSG